MIRRYYLCLFQSNYLYLDDFFLMHINDVFFDLAFNAKLFADDTSLFSVVENMTKSANELNNDLAKIITWAFQWKMNFNPDPTKQAQDVIFSQKLQNKHHPRLIFNQFN